MTRTLLIDADILAYLTTAATEQNIDWGDGVRSHVADFEAAKKAAVEWLEEIVETLKADGFIICLSDDFNNFRKGVWPAYKSNRSSSQRPEHLYDLKDWLRETYPTRSIPTLEADDVMGILSTEPHEGERIIVSADKDMQTIPGLLFNPNKDKRPRRITVEEADRFLLWQTVCGDATDGYPGCPGAGPAMADKVLDGLMWQVREREFKSGPRKGMKVPEWFSYGCGFSTTWERIVALYQKQGQTEKDAVTMANLARILRHGDFEGGRVKPWVPPR
ncbi:hypothetical protein [Sphingomonas sp.]|uniref:hypothetical protein n=1 Tax=Sphingomonas sp. TaxID=28214 RepID=UPI002EDA150C